VQHHGSLSQPEQMLLLDSEVTQGRAEVHGAPIWMRATVAGHTLLLTGAIGSCRVVVRPVPFSSSTSRTRSVQVWSAVAAASAQL
jgi:hypothetical protein